MRNPSVAAMFLLLAVGCQTSRPPTLTGLKRLADEAEEALAKGQFDRLGQISQKGLDDSILLGDLDRLWLFKHFRFEFLINSGRNSELLPILEGFPPDHLLARIVVDRARANLWLNHLDKAEAELDRAAKLSLEGDNSLVAEFAVARADLLDARRETLAAEKLYREALQAARAARAPRLEVKAAGNWAYCLKNRGALDQAAAAYEVVLKSARKADNKGSQAIAEVGLGDSYFRLGLYARAERALHDAAAVASEIHNAYLLSLSQGNLGNVYLGQRDVDSAIKYYRMALESAPNDQMRASWLNNLASAHIELGLWSQAQGFIDEAMPIKERDGESDAIAPALVNQAEIHLGEGELDKAEKLLSDLLARKDDLAEDVLWATYACLGELGALRGNIEEATRYYQLALDEIERSRELIDIEQYQISFRSKWSRFSRDYVDFLVEQGQPVQALQGAEASRAVLLSQGLGIHRPDSRTGATQLKQLANRLNAVLLSYWVAPKRSFLWVVTRDDLKLFMLPGEEEIESLVSGYQNYLLRYLDPIAPAGLPNSFGSSLFEKLVKPAAEMVPPGSNVIIVPDGALNDLNFETLPIGGDQPHYWIQDVTLSVAPSLAILQPTPPASHADKTLLLIGDPVVVDKAYPALEGVKREIENISLQFGEGDQDTIVGPAAVPGAYTKAEPGRYRWIHFAAHAVANPIDPLGSSVILSPEGESYRLFARDVEKVPLQAAVVTLSACRSAGAKAYSGEGLVGLAWAFLKSGAHSVVAGLWDVDDKAGAKLMARFYTAMVNGKSPAVALREAKLEILDSPDEWAKPIYWAPFQVYCRVSPFVPARVAGKRITPSEPGD